jgi:hypothetical protein
MKGCGSSEAEPWADGFWRDGRPAYGSEGKSSCGASRMINFVYRSMVRALECDAVAFGFKAVATCLAFRRKPVSVSRRFETR